MKYFKTIMLLAALIGFLGAGCKKSKSVFTLQLKGKYGSQSFALNTFNADTTGVVVGIKALQFYISNINLIKTDNSTVVITDVALIDFSNPSSLTIKLEGVEGNFKGIVFGCGLDSAQNATPYPLTAPGVLNNAYGMYWGMNNFKYRFEVMEGAWDTAVLPDMRYGLIYHIGLDSNYRQVQLNKNFTVCCGNPATLSVYLDVRKIFHGDTQTINIAAVNTDDVTSTSDAPALAAKFAGNFSKAFGF